MKERYKRIFDEHLFINNKAHHILEEAVIIPEKYLNIILGDIKQFEKNIIKSDFLNEKLCAIFTNICEKYKIEFIYKNVELNNFIQKGYFDSKSNIIYLICTNMINDIKKSKNDFDSFLATLREIVGHELIHRIQHERDQVKRLKDMDSNNIQKYLSDKFEIMAYAFQAIEWFRNEGLNDKDILSLLQSNKPIKYRNFIIELYHTHFNNHPILKIFYKYMYLYVKG